jgi:hypothetical protein
VTWAWVSAASTAGNSAGLGLDAGTTSRLFDGIVSGNIAHGPGKVTISQVGPSTSVGSTVLVSGNVVDSYGGSSPAFVIDDTNRVRANAVAPFEGAYAKGRLLVSGTATVNATGGVVSINFGHDTRWYARRAVALTSVAIRHPQITAGYFTCDHRRNGTTLAGFNTDADTSNARGREVYTNGVTGTTFAAGDYYDLVITPNAALLPTPITVAIDLYGIEL